GAAADPWVEFALALPAFHERRGWAGWAYDRLVGELGHDATVARLAVALAIDPAEIYSAAMDPATAPRAPPGLDPAGMSPAELLTALAAEVSARQQRLAAAEEAAADLPQRGREDEIPVPGITDWVILPVLQALRSAGLAVTFRGRRIVLQRAEGMTVEPHAGELVVAIAKFADGHYHLHGYPYHRVATVGALVRKHLVAGRDVIITFHPIPQRIKGLAYYGDVDAQQATTGFGVAMLAMRGKLTDAHLFRQLRLAPPQLVWRMLAGITGGRFDIPGGKLYDLATQLVEPKAYFFGERTFHKENVTLQLGDQAANLLDPEYPRTLERLRAAASHLRAAMADERLDRGEFPELAAAVDDLYSARAQDVVVRLHELADPAVATPVVLRQLDAALVRLGLAEETGLGAFHIGRVYGRGMTEFLEGLEETGAVGVVHNDAGEPMLGRDGFAIAGVPDMRYLVAFLAALREHPRARVVLAHVGTGKYTTLSPEYLGFLEAEVFSVREERFPNLYVDVSWNDLAQHITETSEIRDRFVRIAAAHHRMLIFGTDSLKSPTEDHHLRHVRDMGPILVEIDALAPGAQDAIVFRNLIALLAVARADVRAWRIRNVESGVWDEVLDGFPPRYQQWVRDRVVLWRMRGYGTLQSERLPGEGPREAPISDPGPHPFDGDEGRQLRDMRDWRWAISDRSATGRNTVRLWWRAVRIAVRDLKDGHRRPAAPAPVPAAAGELPGGGRPIEALVAVDQARRAGVPESRRGRVLELVDERQAQIEGARAEVAKRSATARRAVLWLTLGAALAVVAVLAGLWTVPAALGWISSMAFVARGLLTLVRTAEQTAVRVVHESMYERGLVTEQKVTWLHDLVRRNAAAYGVSSDRLGRVTEVTRQFLTNVFGPGGLLRRPLEDGESRAERHGRLVQEYSRWTDLTNRAIGTSLTSLLTTGAQTSVGRAINATIALTFVGNLAFHALTPAYLLYAVSDVLLLAPVLAAAVSGWFGFNIAAWPWARKLTNYWAYPVVTLANIGLTATFLVEGATAAAATSGVLAMLGVLISAKIVAAAVLTGATSYQTELALQTELGLGVRPSSKLPTASAYFALSLIMLGLMTAPVPLLPAFGGLLPLLALATVVAMVNLIRSTDKPGIGGWAHRLRTFFGRATAAYLTTILGTALLITFTVPAGPGVSALTAAAVAVAVPVAVLGLAVVRRLYHRVRAAATGVHLRPVDPRGYALDGLRRGLPVAWAVRVTGAHRAEITRWIAEELRLRTPPTRLDPAARELIDRVRRHVMRRPSRLPGMLAAAWHHQVLPAELNTPAARATIRRYSAVRWVVRHDGSVWIAPAQVRGPGSGRYRVAHPVLSEGAEVVAAGTARFTLDGHRVRGRITFGSRSFPGTAHPAHGSRDAVAAAFARYGVRLGSSADGRGDRADSGAVPVGLAIGSGAVALVGAPIVLGWGAIAVGAAVGAGTALLVAVTVRVLRRSAESRPETDRVRNGAGRVAELARRWRGPVARAVHVAAPAVVAGSVAVAGAVFLDVVVEFAVLTVAGAAVMALGVASGRLVRHHRTTDARGSPAGQEAPSTVGEAEALKVSLLMAVWRRTHLGFLVEAFRSSVNDQTRPPDEVVIVFDGPVPDELAELVDELAASTPVPVQVVRLARNVGLGPALDAGLAAASHPVIARMDADDISLPHRLAVQMPIIESGVDIVGSGLVEFGRDPDDVLFTRSVATDPEEIARRARFATPFFHPSVVFRREAVARVGGYGDFATMEDYHLWGKLIVAGARVANVAEPLVKYRVGAGAYARRGGMRQFRAEMGLQRRFRALGFTTRTQFVRNVIIRGGYRFVPVDIRRVLYRTFIAGPRRPADAPPTAWLDERVPLAVPPAMNGYRRMHEHPELSGEEHETADFLVAELRALGLEPRRVGGTGVVVDVGDGPRVVAIRADIDALPVPEESDLPYASSRAGVCHACGHDIHTAVVLGVAHVLAGAPPGAVRSRVRLIFQPAEEAGTGADAMVAAGVLDGVEQVYGLHVMPQLFTGTIGIRPGTMNYSADAVRITVTGRAGPDDGVNPNPLVLGLAARVPAVWERLLREHGLAANDEGDPIAFSFGEMHGRAGEAVLAGTLRSGTPEARELAQRLLPQALQEAVDASQDDLAGAGVPAVAWEIEPLVGMVVNDEALTRLVSTVAARQVGSENLVAVEASPGGDDFASLSGLVPGVYLSLGIRRAGAAVEDLHSGLFPAISDPATAVPAGIGLFSRVAVDALAHLPPAGAAAPSLDEALARAESSAPAVRPKRRGSVSPRAPPGDDRSAAPDRGPGAVGTHDALIDDVRITVTGRAGHGSRPRSGPKPAINANTMLGEVVPRLEGSWRRMLADAGVLSDADGTAVTWSFGRIAGGEAKNAIPDRATAAATLWSANPEVRSVALRLLERAAEEAFAAARAQMVATGQLSEADRDVPVYRLETAPGGERGWSGAAVLPAALLLGRLDPAIQAALAEAAALFEDRVGLPLPVALVVAAAVLVGGTVLSRRAGPAVRVGWLTALAAVGGWLGTALFLDVLTVLGFGAVVVAAASLAGIVVGARVPSALRPGGAARGPPGAAGVVAAAGLLAAGLAA
ncbi:amidohydrolase, partial [Pseudonocardia zijingensis]|uniref:amidohydrolase n=1 Tax=Pseudonocardia zijingensis TaxID=153376 RepID=UPI0031CEAE0B